MYSTPFVKVTITAQNKARVTSRTTAPKQSLRNIIVDALHALALMSSPASSTSMLPAFEKSRQRLALLEQEKRGTSEEERETEDMDQLLRGTRVGEPCEF